MKKIAFLVCCLMIFGMKSFGFSGHAEGNGGGAYEQEKVREFLQITDLVISDLESWGKSQFREISAEMLKEYKGKTIIHPVESNLFMGEEKRDAKNYPAFDSEKGLIEFMISAWDAKNILEKKALVFHEFCGIAQIETNEGEVSDYSVSSRYKTLLLERDAETEVFREKLRFYIKDLGEAISTLFSVNTEEVLQRLSDIKRSEVYKTASHVQGKRSVVAEATVKLFEMLSTLPILGDLKSKMLVREHRLQSFQNWMEELNSSQRRSFVRHSLQEIEDAYEQYRQEINQIYEQSLEVMWEKSNGLALGKAAEYAFNYMETQGVTVFPQEIQRRQELMQNKLEVLLKEVDRYYE